MFCGQHDGTTLHGVSHRLVGSEQYIGDERDWRLFAGIHLSAIDNHVSSRVDDGFSSFFLENRYLLLYFIPGITQQQLDSYLERLPARHQYVLVRPGLGQFFGSDFMRVVMGQSRYNDLLLEDSREEEIIQHDASRQLFPQEANE